MSRSKRVSNHARAELWDEAADAWVRFVRGGFDYYREYLNTPATLKVIGPVRGLRVLDLGCGEGYHARILARRGARVTAIDASARMIHHAMEEERRKPLGLRYLVRNAANLRGLRSGSFDLVASFMAMMDVPRAARAIREVGRVLRRGGRFVFSIPHPCFDTVFHGGKMVSGWVRRGGVPHVGEALHFRVDDYFRTGPFRASWTLRGTDHTFVSEGWHLTLQDWSKAALEAGFVMRRLVEPRPVKEVPRVYSGLKKVNRVPHSLILECVREGVSTVGWAGIGH